MSHHSSVQFQREQLHRAAQDGDAAKVVDLLKRKYPVNRFDELGKTPLHYPAAGEHLVVVDLLLRAGADVNARDDRTIDDTQLGACAESCSLEMATRLIGAGTDPTISGWMGLTALDRAKNNSRAAGRQIHDLLLAAAKQRLKQAGLK